MRSELLSFAAVNQAQHDALRHGVIGHLEREMRKQTWRLVTVMVAVGGLIVAGVRLRLGPLN